MLGELQVWATDHGYRAEGRQSSRYRRSLVATPRCLDSYRWIPWELTIVDSIRCAADASNCCVPTGTAAAKVVLLVVDGCIALTKELESTTT